MATSTYGSPRRLMATHELQGTVEEQAAQLYDMALEATEEGRYAAATRYLREIERAVPGFRDVPQRLAQADYSRREQRFLALGSMTGAILFIIAARLSGTDRELVFLGAAVLGLIVGVLVSLVLFPRLVPRPQLPPSDN